MKRISVVEKPRYSHHSYYTNAMARASLKGSIPPLIALLVLLLPNLAPGTIAEQRARLPPPAECDHPVYGIWKSHSFYKQQSNWYVFTLNVKPKKDSKIELEGRIDVHFWSGNKDAQEPPPCRSRNINVRLHMPAKGTYNNGEIVFGGVDRYEVDEMICGSRRLAYYLDSFTGKIDKKLQEFQSLNNDGGAAVNVPTVFRRISCLNDALPEGKAVPPPPFTPPTKRSGCL